MDLDKNEEKMEKLVKAFDAAVGMRVAENVLDISTKFAFKIPRVSALIMLLEAGFANINLVFDEESDEYQSRISYIRGIVTATLDLLMPYVNDELQGNRLTLYDQNVKLIEGDLDKLADRAKEDLVSNLIGDYYEERSQEVINNAKINDILLDIFDEVGHMHRHGRAVRTSQDEGKELSDIEIGIHGIIAAMTLGEGLLDIKDALIQGDLPVATREILGYIIHPYYKIISTISDLITPMVRFLFYDMSRWVGEPLERKSDLLLNFNQVKISEQLRQLKGITESLLAEANIVSQLPDLIGTTARSLDLIFKEHEKIPGIVEKSIEINFYRDLVRNRGPCQINDPNLLIACRDYDEQITKYNLLWMTRKAANVFKQHVFPFAYKYVEYTNIMALDQRTITPNEVNSKIESLLKRIVTSPTKITEIEDIYETRKFCEATNPPLFEWTDKFKNELRRIFSGEKVRLHAPVYQGVVDKDVVRVKKIYIQFQSSSADEDKELQEALDQFWVRMTHTGDSQFRVLGKFFASSHEMELNIFYKYSREEKVRYQYSDGNYRKLSDGDYVISPYTTWDIWLHAESEQGFQALKKFNNSDISLKLCGLALHVDTKALSDIIGIDIDQVESLYGIDEDLTNWESYLH